MIRDQNIDYLWKKITASVKQFEDDNSALHAGKLSADEFSSRGQKHAYSITRMYFYIFKILCENKAALVKDKESILTISRTQTFLDNLNIFTSKCMLLNNMLTLALSGNLDARRLFGQAMIEGIHYLKKQIRLGTELLSEMRLIIAISAARILIAIMNGKKKYNAIHYAQLMNNALQYKDVIKKSLPESLAHEITLGARESYAILALAQMRDGYYNAAEAFLSKGIEEAEAAGSFDRKLFKACRLYLLHFLEAKNRTCTSLEQAEKIVGQLENAMKYTVVGGVYAKLTEEYKHFQKYCIRQMLQDYHQAIFAEREAKALRDIQVDINEPTPGKQEKPLPAAAVDVDAQYNISLATLMMSSAGTRLGKNPIKKPAAAENNPAPAPEAARTPAVSASDLEKIYEQLGVPKKGYSKPIMIRSSNGGFPDNTHFLCVEDSPEFNDFMKTIHNKGEVAYSVPEKGRGQPGVKINPTTNEIRIKRHGDLRAKGKCVREIFVPGIGKVRLFLINSTQSHKERERSEKRSRP
jgi:hypothetical protein